MGLFNSREKPPQEDTLTPEEIKTQIEEKSNQIKAIQEEVKTASFANEENRNTAHAHNRKLIKRLKEEISALESKLE